MFSRLRTQLLRIFRVPHDPEPPAGAPGSVRVFRAGQNFYKLRLLRWGLGQIGALLGIAFSLGLLDRFEEGAEEFRAKAQRQQAAAVAPAASTGTPTPAAGEEARPPRKKPRPRESIQERVGRTAERWPMWVFPLLRVIEWGGVLLYLIQIPLTYAMVRLDFELRWYMVTDRSLRIRSGLTTMQELTMSFANIQQVAVVQGPLQRLLGLADVRVQSAGGGGGEQAEAHGLDSAHTGVFHGVDNATEIRDLILARLKRFRESGLGDPDEIATPAPVPAEESDPLRAAQELLAEARALRRTLAG